MLVESSFASEALDQIAYDADRRTLYVCFRTGGVYEYQDVARETFDALCVAESKGRFFQSHIRNRFSATRLKAGAAGELKRRLARSGGALRTLVLTEMAKIDARRPRGVFF